MAARTWNSGASTDMNDGNNYTGAGPLLATDDLTFDGTSAVNAIATGNLDVQSITCTNAWSGNWDMNGNNLTVSGAASYDGDSSGDLTIDGTFTQDADGNFTVTGNWNSVSMSSATFYFQGTGSLNWGPNTVGSVTCSYNGKTTTYANSSIGGVIAGTLTLQAGGTFTSNENFKISTSGAVTPFTANGATINGNGNNLTLESTGASTFTIPAFTVSDSIQLYFRVAGVHLTTFSQSGAINTGTGRIETYGTSSGSQITWNTNNHNVTCGNVRLVHTWPSGAITASLGSSTVDISQDFLTNVSAGVTSTVNLNSATITIARHLTIDADTDTFDAGTSSITFDGGDPANITLNGKSLYTVMCNKSANGVTLVDAFNSQTFEVDDGDFTTNGQTITTVSNITIDGDDSITIDSTCTMSGNGTFHIGNTISAATLTSMAVFLQGNCTLDIDVGGEEYASLTCAYAGKVTTYTGAGGAVGGVYTGPRSITLATGTFTLNTAFYINCKATSTITINAAATINGGATFQYMSGMDTSTVDLPAATYGCAGLYISFFTYGDGTIRFTGTQTVTGANGVIVYKAGNNTSTLNFNNQDATITANLNMGAAVAGNNLVVNFGSGNVSCRDFLTSTYNVGTSQLNLQTSHITVNRHITIGTNTTIVQGTGQVTLASANNSQLTMAGESLYRLNLSKTIPATVTCLDKLTMSNRLVWSAGQNVTFNSGVGNGLQIGAFTAGDWNGTLANNIVLVSDNPGTSWEFTNVAGMTVSHCNVTDSDASPGGNTINAYDGTNTDGGNNSAEWDFIGTATGFGGFYGGFW